MGRFIAITSVSIAVVVGSITFTGEPASAVSLGHGDFGHGRQFGQPRQTQHGFKEAPKRQQKLEHPAERRQPDTLSKKRSNRPEDSTEKSPKDKSGTETDISKTPTKTPDQTTVPAGTAKEQLRNQLLEEATGVKPGTPASGKQQTPGTVTDTEKRDTPPPKPLATDNPSPLTPGPTPQPPTDNPPPVPPPPPTVVDSPPPPAPPTPPPVPTAEKPPTDIRRRTSTSYPIPVQYESCDDCAELLELINRYKSVLDEDQKTVTELEARRASLVDEKNSFQAKLAKATGPEQEYIQSIIKIDDGSIKAKDDQIASLEKLISEEEAFLDDLLEQLKNCFERFCKGSIPNETVLAPPPPTPPPPPPPPVNPPLTAPGPNNPPLATPDACHGPPGQKSVDFDFNPNGPRPPAPKGEVFVMPPNTGAKMMSFTLLTFYEGGAGRSDRAMIKSSSYYADDFGGSVDTSTPKFPYDDDSVILDDETLEAVRGQDRVDLLQRAVNFRLGQDAQQMLDKLGCDQRGTFTDRGLDLAWGDAMSIQLGLGTFSLYWEASCRVGPKRCCIPDSTCPSGYSAEVPYTCAINWTLYKTYNFSYQTGTGGNTWWGKINRVFKAINPVGWVGHRFNAFGYWNFITGGSESACMSATSVPATPVPRTQSK